MFVVAPVPDMVLAVICAVGVVPVLDVILLLVDNVELGFVVDNNFGD